MANLTDLDAVKAYLRKQDTAQDAQIIALIPAASAAIESYTSRQFTPDAAASQRRFDVTNWGGVGRINIGDLSAVPTGVSIVSGTVTTPLTLAELEWLPLVRRTGRPITGLDLYGVSFGWRDRLAVTGIWGWPAVPAEVAHACVVTVAAWVRSEVTDLPLLNSDEPGAYLPRPFSTAYLPAGVRGLLAPFRRIPVGMGT